MRVKGYDSKLKIFVVDDNRVFLHSLANRVKKATGGTVKEFTTAEDCLMAMNEKPDLILSDYYLDSDYSQKMNGDSLLTRVKKMNPRVEVIMYSSRKSLDNAINLLKQGAVDYLSKDHNAEKRIVNRTIKALHNIRNKYLEKRQRRFIYMFLAIMVITNLGIFSLSEWSPEFLPYIFLSAIVLIIVGTLFSAMYKKSLYRLFGWI